MPTVSSSPERPQRPSLFCRVEQALLAAVVAASLLAMTAAWLCQGGHRDRLIEIDRAEPVEINFYVDLNSADWPELAQLPNVGETLARRIVKSREIDGPYRDHEDLTRVRGIGPKTLDGLRPYLLSMPEADAVAAD